MVPSNAPILQATSESVSDTVSDTDTPPIRPRYVSLEYPRINDLKQLRYSKDTSPVRFGYFSSPGKSPLSPVKKQPATLVPRCPHPFPHSVFPPSHAHTRRRLCRQQLLTQVPGPAAVAASRRRAPPPTHQRPLSRTSHVWTLLFSISPAQPSSSPLLSSLISEDLSFSSPPDGFEYLQRIRIGTFSK